MSITSRRLLQLGLLVLVTGGVGCSQRRSSQAPSPERPSEGGSVAASTVKSDDIDRAPSESIEKMLEGRVAGVVVGRAPDGSIAVRIRGASSVYGNTEPLYVVDGLPVQAGANGALTGISPSDIESIRVLKDVADTAIYGLRGANGVIVVKTKRPSAKTKP